MSKQAIHDNGTSNITTLAHTFDQCTQKMLMLDSIPLPGSEIMSPGLCADNATDCGQ